MKNKYNIGDKVVKGKKVLIVKEIFFTKRLNEYYYTFEKYPYFEYEHSLKPYKEKENKK